MKLSVDRRTLRDYVGRQLTAFFPDGGPAAVPDDAVEDSLARLEAIHVHVADRSFWSGDKPYFNHLHSDQYAMFLYLLANTLHRQGAPASVCEKLFCLNKTLYGIDAFYEVELPRVFLFCHAGGTVLGRGTYGDFFLVYQHCTVGSARAAEEGSRGVFPVLGRHVSLYAGATVLGACHLGDNCKISTQSVILNKRLRPDTMYRGMPQSFETATFPFPDNIWRTR